MELTVRVESCPLGILTNWQIVEILDFGSYKNMSPNSFHLSSILYFLRKSIPKIVSVVLDTMASIWNSFRPNLIENFFFP